MVKAEINKDGKIIYFNNFIPGVRCGITTNEYGNFNFINATANDKQIILNRHWELMSDLNIDRYHKIIPQHSSEVCCVLPEQKDQIFFECDGLFIDTKEQIANNEKYALFSLTGDCPTIVFACNWVIGIVHSSLRSTLTNVAKKTLDSIKSNIPTACIKNTIAIIWPGICENCYEIGGDFADVVRRKYPSFLKNHNGYHVGLAEIIEHQLINLGVPPTQICTLHEFCSFGDPALFYSYRRKQTENNVVFITPNT